MLYIAFVCNFFCRFLCSLTIKIFFPPKKKQKKLYIYIHSNTYIHVHITEVKRFMVCYLIGEMDTQALFAAGTYTALDIYEKCRAR